MPTEVWCKGKHLFTVSDDKRPPFEGAYLTHEGTLYQVTHTHHFYSAAGDSHDLCAMVAPVPLFHFVFTSRKDVDAAYAEAEKSDLSDAAYIRTACRMKPIIDEILRDELRGPVLRELIGLSRLGPLADPSTPTQRGGGE